MKKWGLVLGLMAIFGGLRAADMQSFVYYNNSPNLLGQNSGVYVWEASPSVLWKVPYAIGMVDTSSVEVGYNSVFEFFSIVNGVATLPFKFGNIAVGFMNVSIPDMATDNSQLGVLLGYGHTVLNGALNFGIHFNYFNQSIDTYYYNLLTASLGVAYSFSRIPNKYIRSLEIGLNVVELKLFANSSVGGDLTMPVKFNFGLRYDIFDLMYVPNMKLFVILNGEMDEEGFAFASGLALTIKETLSAMVSYDRSVNFGLGIFIAGININYWIDPGIMNRSLGTSQRLSVNINFDMLGSKGTKIGGNTDLGSDPEVLRKKRDDLFTQAQILYDEEKYAECIKQLNEVLNLDPTYKRALELMKLAGAELDKILKEKSEEDKK